MATFSLPPDLAFNTERLADPAAFARQHHAVSWLYLNGPEFGAMEGGMTFAQVQAAVPHAANVVSDPPRTLDLELARAQVAALDALPRPTVVSCRAGPRASAVAYMYAGLRSGAEAEEVLARARADGAPFCRFEAYEAWVRLAITTLRAAP